MLESTKLINSDEPVDRYNLIWLLCLILGAGQMFPFNVFLSALDHASVLYSPYPFAFIMPIVNNWSNMVCFLLYLKIGKKLQPKTWMYSCYLICFVCLFAIPVIEIFFSKLLMKMFLTLLSVLICGGLSALMTGTTFGMLGPLPPQYTGALMAGQAGSGILSSFIKLPIEFWWFPGHDHTQLYSSDALFFGIASLFCLLVMFATWLLCRSNFYRYYTEGYKYKSDPEKAIQNEGYSKGLSEFQETSTVNNYTPPPSLLDVLKKIKSDAFHVFLVFLISLTFYPGFILMIKNDDATLSDPNFILLLVSVFQLFDFIGRTLPKWLIFPKSPDYVWIPCWLRLLLIPCFIISIYTTWLPSNYVAFVFVALFAWSGGYFSTLLMMNGPQKVGPEESAKAGMLMACFLQVGVFVGVHVAMILMLIIEGPKSVIGE